MIVEIDFNSEEALYIQLINQIIIGIATDQIREGDTLPSVRQLADNIGINMHTVNKAYSVLKQEGFLRVDRRRGAVIALDTDKMRTISEMRRDLSVILARGVCKNVSRIDVDGEFSGFGSRRHLFRRSFELRGRGRFRLERLFLRKLMIDGGAFQRRFFCFLGLLKKGRLFLFGSSLRGCGANLPFQGIPFKDPGRGLFRRGLGWRRRFLPLLLFLQKLL